MMLRNLPAGYEKGLYQKIKAQANAISDGWMAIDLQEVEDINSPHATTKTTIMVARIPFERWTHGADRHRSDEWPNISPLNLKLNMDDRNHSDWWISSGLPLNRIYTITPSHVRPANRLDILAYRFNRTAWHIKLNFDEHGKRDRWMFLIKPKRKINGFVMQVKTAAQIAEFVEEAKSWKKAYNSHDMIAVIPNASSFYDLIIKHAGAIITPVGSKAAHLVKVAREEGTVAVVLCPDAFERFFDGERLIIENDSIRRGQ